MRGGAADPVESGSPAGPGSPVGPGSSVGPGGPVGPGSPVGTVAQHALEALRQAIVSAELRPGQRIRQDDWAESIGVSIAPVREALAILEQEGQVTYAPRRGYFVTELRIEDLEEIYELRRVLEERAVRAALPGLAEDALERVTDAALACVDAASTGNITAELAANRRFHFALMESDSQVHTLRLIRLLWDSTEAYRALYYSTPQERSAAGDAHERIIAATLAGDADALVRELDEHRERALVVLRGILTLTE